MIIIKIMGGLGNQMFQYALARRLQLMGRNVKIDTSYFDDIPDTDTPRLKWVTKFNYKFYEISKFEKKYRMLIMNSVYTIIKQKPYIFIERDYNYDSSIIKKKHAYLIGYWQTVKYFDVIGDILKEDFKFNMNELTKEEKSLYEELKNIPNSVSVHVRMGDYRNRDNFSIFVNICNSDYYIKACEMCQEKLNDCTFFVFTDSPSDFEKNIRLNVKYKLIFTKEKNDWFELFLMSSCKNNIIANSTFSWWAAWLNSNPDKLVISPDRWTNENDRKDILCESWIKILC